MKELLIKLLGGMTRLQHLEEIEKLKDDCEEFCSEYLHLNGNNHSWQGHLQGASTEGNLVVLKSETSLSNCTCDRLVVAPWARRVIAYDVKNIQNTSKGVGLND